MWGIWNFYSVDCLFCRDNMVAAFPAGHCCPVCPLTVPTMLPVPTVVWACKEEGVLPTVARRRARMKGNVLAVARMMMQLRAAARHGGAGL